MKTKICTLAGLTLLMAQSYGATFNDGGTHVYTAAGEEEISIENGSHVTLDGLGGWVKIMDGSATVNAGSFLGVMIYTGSSGEVTGGTFSRGITAFAGSSLTYSGGTAPSMNLAADYEALASSSASGVPGYTIDAVISGGTISGTLIAYNSNSAREGIANIDISGSVMIDELQYFTPGSCTVSGGTFRRIYTNGSNAQCQILGATITQDAVVGPDSTLTVTGYNLDYTAPTVSGDYVDLGAFSFPIQNLQGSLILDEIPQIVDTDGDGVPDDEDAFPNDPTESADSDGDGFGDNADEFPNSITELTFDYGNVTLDNEHIANGAWLADEIDLALRSDLSTAELVAILVAMKSDGLITGREMGQIIREHNLS